MRFKWVFIGIAALLLPLSAIADDIETQARALRVIRETAADICNTITQEGTSQLLELSGDVKAKLGGAVAKIADLGIEGAGKYRTEEFRGLLQQELAKAIKDNANCRLEVLKLLQEKMLIPLPKSGANPGAAISINRPCSADSEVRREIIAKMSTVRSRDFEYGTLVMDLMECKSFSSAVEVALQMKEIKEHDGALSAIAMTSMKEKSYNVARKAIDLIVTSTTRDELSRILIAEMQRGPGYDPFVGVYATDLIQLNYGSLGGAVYNYRTGEITDEFQPCVRGRASCSSTTPGYDFSPNFPPNFIPDSARRN